MERSDRILLIIASVIVVIMLAGAGFLLYERWQTMSAAPTAAVSSTSSLTPLEATAAPTPATTTPSPVVTKKSSVPKQPHGTDFGYVTKVRAKGSTVRVTYDNAELLVGDEAKLRESQKGNPLYYNAQYAIANDTHKLTTYPLTKKAIVDIIGADGRSKTVSPADFVTAFAKDKSLHDTTWWVWASGGSITHIAQVAFPPEP